jgi:hypothetical protein
MCFSPLHVINGLKPIVSMCFSPLHDINGLKPIVKDYCIKKSMKSKNKLIFIILLICLCIGINTNAQSIVLHFANGSDIVVAKDIEKFIQSEKREFSCSDIISIYGYTDNVGSDDDNKLLAEK